MKKASNKKFGNPNISDKQNRQAWNRIFQKRSDAMIKTGIQKLIFKLSRERDIAGLIAIILLVVLAVSVYFNISYWWTK